jgi:actin-related protein
MTNTELISEILSDSDIKEKYNISESDLNNINGDARYQKEIVQIIKEIVSDNDNHISATKSYNKLKNILNIV